MPARKKNSTTRLPQSLLEEINKNPNESHKHRSKHQLSRKESRKQERTERKNRRVEYFSQKLKRPAEEEPDSSPQRKKLKLESRSQVNAALTKPTLLETKAQPQKESPKQTQARTKSALEKLVSKADPKPKRTQKEKEEDAYIEYLESKLGYKKGKSVKYDDGLDDLFDFASSLTYAGGIGDVEEMDAEEEDLKGDIEVDADEDTEDGDTEVEQSDEEESDEVEWQGIGGSEGEDGEDEKTSEAPAEEILNPSEVPAAATRYIPPHLRNKEGADKNSEILMKLTRHLKGLLNRMSEQNIGSIVDSIEEVYRNHRRHDVTSTLTTLIIDGICSHSSLLDSYVVLYAAFVCSLYKIIGIEFAAYFVQNVVTSYEQHLSSLRSGPSEIATDDNTQPTEPEDRGKEASNLVVLLSELYNFQVISCVLVYDIIRSLLEGEVHEFNVELLLKVVRNSGQQLRQDDPSALKDIIQIVQTKLAGKEDSISSRTRFMIETLNNLKNNKVKRLGTQNQGGEAVERMKKFLSNLGKKRHVMAHEPLRVSLNDLHSVESKGKWWLVGAAWGGDPLVDKQQDTPKQTEQKTGDMANNLLLKLAKKQGMNTDIRRSIFVVLMSSDDYVDACERLSQLKLSEVQQREIARVLLHCCGNEKAYNPYYTLVCQHLCSLSHSYKITVQYCLWDFFRSLGENNVGGVEVIKSLKENGGDDGFDVKSISLTRIRNVAKAYAWWVAKDCVTLAILKPVDFMLLKPQTQKFLKEFFIQLFLSSQSPTPLITKQTTSRNRAAVEEIFIKASRVQSLSMGLVFFLSQNFSEDDTGEPDENISKLVKWGVEVAKETLRVGMDVIPNL